MSDFHQSGSITTLHKLGNVTPDVTEREIKKFSEKRPVALILPSLITELDGEALPGIIKALQSVSYLSKIVVTLGPATEKDFKRAKETFARLPQPTVLIWNNGPRVSALYKQLEETGLSAGPDGKGRSVWMAMGYLLSDAVAEVIALHDCDIVTYDRGILDRLVFPVASQDMGYQFCKGYYARFSDRLHGRVTRLFVTPFIRALTKMIGDLPILTYLDAFRYPLAGEFCLSDDMAWVMRIPSDWGLEIGVLSEIYRNSSPNRICQSELCDRYDHKHQVLSTHPDKGLSRMVADIAKTFYRILTGEGIILTDAFFNTLKGTYRNLAHQAIQQFGHVSQINGLAFDRHSELVKIETFTNAITFAGRDFLENPGEDRRIPSWSRVDAALPDFLTDLSEAVETDNRL
jgi:glucosyl-3-phosphoglycerate synthase